MDKHLHIRPELLRTIRSITAYFSASAIPLMLNLIANPFIAMNMSPEDFAITGYYTSFSTLLTPLINFYFLHYYSKRYFECNKEERAILKATIFKLLIVYSLIASVLCLLGVFGYIKLFNTDIHFSIFPYLPLAILSIPLTGIYNLELTDYKMQKNGKKYFHLSVTAGVINTIAVVVLVVVLKLGAFGKLLAPLSINLGIFLYLLIKHSDLWQIHTGKSYIVSMFKFCWPLTIAAMLGYFTNGFDKTYLETVGDVTEYGYYCVASSIAAYLYVFSTAVYNTFTPDVYEAIASHNNPKLLKTFGIQQGMNGLIVILFVLFCPLLIYILTAGRYIESTTYARILAVATFTQTFYFNINCFTIAKGYPKLSMWTSILGGGLIVVAMSYVVKHWTYTGGAWMVSFSYIILVLVNIVLLFGAAGKEKSIGFIRSVIGSK